MRNITLITFAMMSFSSSVYAGEAEITISDVLQKTYDNNPTIRSAYHGLKAVFEQVDLARSNYRPVVVGSLNATVTDIDNDPGSSGSDFSKSGEVSLSQPLYRGGRTTADVLSAQHAVLAQYETYNSVVQNILLQAATAYYDVVEKSELVELNEKNIVRLSRQLDYSKERYDLGDLTRTDVSQSEARLQQAKSSLSRAQSGYQSAWATLTQYSGVEVSEDVSDDIVVSPVEFSMDILELESIAFANNPDLKAARHVYMSAKHDVREQYGELLPEISLIGSYGISYDPVPGVYDDTKTGVLGISLSVPLYQAGSIRSNLDRLKLISMQKQEQIDVTRRSVRQNLVSELYKYQASTSEVSSRQKQVEANNIAVEGVYAEMEVGTRTVLDTLDAEQELLDAKSSLVTAERNAMVSNLSLAASAGLLNPERVGIRIGDDGFLTEIQSLSSVVSD